MKSAPLLLAAALLSGCDRAAETSARLTARQLALDPPQLWSIQPLGPTAVPATYLCADTPMREGFARTRTEIDGAPCRPTARPVERPGLSALKCESGGRSYAFSSMTRGDLARDFELTVAITPLDPALGPARTTRRFRRLGACPTGWRIGDEGQATAGLPAVLRPRPAP